MVICGFAVSCMSGLLDMALSKFGSASLAGLVLQVDLAGMPPSMDVVTLCDAESEVAQHTTEELQEAYKRAIKSGDTLVICHYPRAPYVGCVAKKYSWYAYLANQTMFDFWMFSRTFPPSSALVGRLSFVDKEKNQLMGDTVNKVDQIRGYLAYNSAFDWLLEPEGTRRQKLYRKIHEALDLMKEELSVSACFLLSNPSRWTTELRED